PNQRKVFQSSIDAIPSVDTFTLSTLIGSDSGRYSDLPAWIEDLAAVQLNEAERVLVDDDVRAKYERNVQLSLALETWFADADRSTPMRDPHIAPALQLVFNGIRQNRCRIYFVDTEDDYFDTHSENLSLQRLRVPPVLDDIATFIDM